MRVVSAWMACLIALIVLPASPAAAQGGNTGAATERLRIVGGLAGVNQYTRQEEPFWTRRFGELTQGRATAEIVPFDRAGLHGQDMARLVQIGAVPFGTMLLSVSAAIDPELVAADLAGQSPDCTSLRRSVAAYRPHVEALLRERYGIELLAVYTYPAQVTFCNRPLASLADLAGRRVRISSASQADLVRALGGTPVQTAFADIVASLRKGNIDCAITGTMSGNTIGLHEVTSHILDLPITWGLAAFVANGQAWKNLSPEVKTVLRRELPELESAIWSESERETQEGIACNTGTSDCITGRKGNMTLVRASAADLRRRQELLVQTVLPAWFKRCGPACVQLWNQTLAPVAGRQPR